MHVSPKGGSDAEVSGNDAGAGGGSRPAVPETAGAARPEWSSRGECWIDNERYS